MEPAETIESIPEQVAPGFLELAYGIIFNPQKIFTRLAEVEALRPAFWLVVIYFVVNSLTNMLVVSAENQFGEVPYMELLNSTVFVVAASLFGIIIGMIFWVVSGGVFNILAEIMGGKGNGRKVLTVTGISMLPNILLTPAAVLFYVGGLDMTIYNVLSGIVFLYTGIVLPIMGIARVHHMTTLKSVTVVLFPILSLIALTILAVGTAFALFATQLPF